ncbi:MAG: hypothetical protein JNN12_09720 [Bacteroidetes Order II. Incertae sedis bacterium]|nr:hypothetical protein [Bacteroidetes Order II. bacterium]
MVLRPFTEGIKNAAQRPKLILLLWLMGLVIAAFMAIPATFALEAFAHVLPEGNPDIWKTPAHQTAFWELLIRVRSAFGTTLLNLLWVLPLVWIWKVAYAVGLYHAFRTETPGTFREGVARYWSKGMALSLRFVVLSIGIQVVLITLFMVLGLMMQGERVLFWLFAVIWPTLAISAYALIALFQDYARVAVVLAHVSPKAAFRSGLRFPFRYGNASKLFLLWFAVTLFVGILPNVIELRFGFTSPVASWIVFLLTQILLFIRAAAIVAWHSSNVVFYTAARFYDEAE